MRNQRGAALVEMVMILPVLTILFLGIVQFGLVLREHQVVQNAAREGARLSMLPNYSRKGWNTSSGSACPLSTIANVVAQYLSTEGISVTADAEVDIANCNKNIDPAPTSGSAGLSGGGVSSATVTIDQNVTTTLSDGTTVGMSKVTISYTKSALVGGSFFGTFTYKGEAVFRNLY
jgi:Flp pilus assembly protein TadG